MGLSTWLLCGSLGSGKTTLLKHFLALPEGRDTAVVVNEVGEVGIDAHLLHDVARNAPVTLIGNGCVCCSVRGSLGEAVERVLRTRHERGLPPARRLVIELSGLARPGEVIRELSSWDGIIAGFTVVAMADCALQAASPAPYLAEPEPAAMAHVVAFTKPEGRDAAFREMMRARIHAVNPLARTIWEDTLPARAARAFSSAPAISPSVPRLACHDGAPAHPAIRVMKAEWPEGMSWSAIQAWLDATAAFLGSRLLRIKGFVAVAECDEPILVEAVGTVFSTPRRMATDRNLPLGLVLIAADISAHDLATADFGTTTPRPEITATWSG
ncbi:GTP-binding protein [Gluconacetobacter azotocaptans]|uniref:CobW family GTP-binding protein n=1 Tax=Gluconacetobacter azotocaptans TaxID=142834 RepID=UPI00195C12F3|nr:GTP-binding protein [Gluconacetobacter azotocaptans]MBM9400759.1 GTP-binding protein [Gluconacetobacter azotocaptans]